MKTKQRILFLLLFSVFVSAIFTLSVFGSASSVSLNAAPQSGAFRWLDVAGQAYKSSYQNSYNYGYAAVTVSYDASGETFQGVVNAVNLKPNFAYQLKMIGAPGTLSNEKIGF